MKLFHKTLTILTAGVLLAYSASSVLATYGNVEVGGDCQNAWVTLTPIPDHNVEKTTINGQDTRSLHVPWNGATSVTFNTYIQWNGGRHYSESKTSYKDVEECGEIEITPTPQLTPTPEVTPTPSEKRAYCTGLEANPSEGTAALYVKFAAAGVDMDGSIKEYRFNFDDNSDNQPQRVNNMHPEATHVYHNPGTYKATVEVIDSRGVWHGGNSECEVEITVKSEPQVQSSDNPPALPETGLPFNVLVGAVGLSAVSAYLYRRSQIV